MKIAVISPPWFPVPPTGYGGIEWVVSLLADGLVDAGHEGSLFASGDSKTKATLEAVFPEAPSEWIGRSFWELRHVLHCYERAGDFDVINDHSGPFAAALGASIGSASLPTSTSTTRISCGGSSSCTAKRRGSCAGRSAPRCSCSCSRSRA
jgi:hypothetical protein